MRPSSFLNFERNRGMIHLLSEVARTQGNLGLHCKNHNLFRNKLIGVLPTSQKFSKGGYDLASGVFHIKLLIFQWFFLLIEIFLKGSGLHSSYVSAWKVMLLKVPNQSFNDEERPKILWWKCESVTATVLCQEFWGH